MHVETGMTKKDRGVYTLLLTEEPCLCIQIMKKIENLAEKERYPQLNKMPGKESKSKTKGQNSSKEESGTKLNKEDQNEETFVLSWVNCKEIGQDLHWDIAKAFMGDTDELKKGSRGPGDVDVVVLSNIILNCELFQQCKKFGKTNIVTEVCTKYIQG